MDDAVGRGWGPGPGRSRGRGLTGPAQADLCPPPAPRPPWLATKAVLGP